MLAPEQCMRARLAKDPRFDGVFFTAVRTTKIFCRPVCPVNPPKEENVQYYPSAAAALKDGFRPCMRCRPEAAPHSPAWQGVKTTAKRAFKLIQQGALSEGSVEQLAQRLGIGPRHLRDLCQQEFFASPIQLEQSRRLLLAKQLITDSNMPLTDIAFVSGFGSVRRFNEAFKQTYDKQPSYFRKGKADSTDKALALKIPVSKDYDFASFLNFYRPRQLPGIEHVGESEYRRGLNLDGEHAIVRVRHDASKAVLNVEVKTQAWQQVPAIIKLVSRQFDTNAPVAHVREHVSQCPALAALIGDQSDFRIPGSMLPFEIAIRAIVGQQVSVKGARTILLRIINQCAKPISLEDEYVTQLFPTADILSAEPLQGLGMPNTRVATLQRFCQAVVEQPELMHDDADANWRHQQLLALKGIGPWTVNYLEMRGFSLPDAFPAGDLGIRQALAENDQLPTEKQVASMAEAWQPWRAYVAIALWQSLARR